MLTCPSPKKLPGLLRSPVVNYAPSPTSKAALLRRLKAAGLPVWGTQAQLETRVKCLGRIVCFDEDIIQTSTKAQLQAFLSDLGMMPPRGKQQPTKKELQMRLRSYLEARLHSCALPATLLKKGKFWRVSVKRRNSKEPLQPPVFVVVSRWGALGRKRNGLVATPMKITPAPTKKQESERIFPTRNEAMRFARSRIKFKLKEGYYLSTEGSLPDYKTNTPVQVRPLEKRGLKFAGILQVREFDLHKSSGKYRDVKEDMEVNFESDHEES